MQISIFPRNINKSESVRGKKKVRRWIFLCLIQSASAEIKTNISTECITVSGFKSEAEWGGNQGLVSQQYCYKTRKEMHSLFSLSLWKKKSCVDSVYKETCGHYVCLYVLLKLGKFKGETPRTVPDQSLYTGCRGAPVRTWSLCGAAGGQWEIWSADWNSLKLCHLSVSDWSWRLRVWKWRKSGGVEWEERGFIRSP